jgi:hypothetical protein
MPTIPLTSGPRVSGMPLPPKTIPHSLRYLPYIQRPKVSTPVLQSALSTVRFRRKSPSTHPSHIPLRPVRSLAAKPPPQVPVPPVGRSHIPHPVFVFYLCGPSRTQRPLHWSSVLAPLSTPLRYAARGAAALGCFPINLISARNPPLESSNYTLARGPSSTRPLRLVGQVPLESSKQTGPLPRNGRRFAFRSHVDFTIGADVNRGYPLVSSKRMGTPLGKAARGPLTHPRFQTVKVSIHHEARCGLPVGEQSEQCGRDGNRG